CGALSSSHSEKVCFSKLNELATNDVRFPGMAVLLVANSRKAAAADAKECVCALISATLHKSQHSLPNIYRFLFVRVRRASARRTFSTQPRSSVNDIKFTICSGGIFAANAA